MFPSVKSLENRDGEEEERRLFYVAVTRAKDELYLSYPMLRFNASQQELLQKPSRFVLEVPPELMEEVKVNLRSRDY
jgi:DNA helicase-2/ATP-dependent DNA helicase PcrA